MQGYCVNCGNTGVMINGKPCHCVQGNTAELKSSIVSPIYSGKWDVNFIEKKTTLLFKQTLLSIFDDVIKCRPIIHNMLILSNANTSRTVFVYTIKNMLAETSIVIPEMLTLLEVSKLPLKDVINPPLLFIKLNNCGVYDPAGYIEALLLMRSKVKHRTIIFYTGSMNRLKKEIDHYSKISELVGTGEFSSIKLIEAYYAEEVNNDISNCWFYRVQG